MAGKQLHDSFIGVGPALRKAREKRRVTLDEASRDTKLSIEHLRALEEERFGDLLGEVYVRGSLRTYAQYLGVDPDKVITAYGRHVEEAGAPPPPPGLGRVERAIAATRIRDNQRLMVVLATTVLVMAVVFGFLSRGKSSPAPANLASPPAAVVPITRSVDAELVALRNAQVTYTADHNAPVTISLQKGETRAISATSALAIRIEDGGTVQLTVNGSELGAPGKAGIPWQRTFTFDTGGSPSPSA